MGKKVEGIITDAVIEKVGSEIGRLMDKMRDLEKEEKIQAEKKKAEHFPEGKEAIKKEFNRTLEKLKKTDPSDDSYYRIVNNLDRLTDLLKYWK